MSFQLSKSILSGLVVGLLASGATFAGTPERAPEQGQIAVIQEIEALAQQTRNQIAESGQIYAWEVAGPRDRIPTMCAEHCACLAKAFALEMKKAGIPFATLQVLPKSGKGFIEFDGVSRGIFKSPSYTSHFITLIKVGGRAYVLDPVVTGSTKLEASTHWAQRVRTPVRFTKVVL